MHSLEYYVRPLAPHASRDLAATRIKDIPAILSLGRTAEIHLSSRLTKGYLRRCVLNWVHCATMLGLSKH